MSNADRDVLIIQRLNKSFNQYPQTSDNKDLFAELFGNLRDSAAEKMAGGKTAEEAVTAAFQEFGDVDELLKQVNEENGTAKKPAPAPKPLPNAAGPVPPMPVPPMPVEPRPVRPKPVPIARQMHQGDQRLTEVQRLTAPSAEIGAITINYPDDLELQPTDSDDFTLIEYMTTDEPDRYARMTHVGDELRIQAGRRSHFGFTLRINELSWGFHARMVLQVPQRFAGDLTIDGDDGNMVLHELGTLASVSVKIDDGNLQVTQIAGSTLNIEGDDGNIGLTELNFPSTSIQVDDGNTKVTNVQAADDFSFAGGDGNLLLDTVNAGSLSISGDDGNQTWSVIRAGDTDVSFSDGRLEATDVILTNLNLSYDDGRAAFRQTTVQNPITASYEDGNLTLEQFTGAGDFTLEDGRFAGSFTKVTGDITVTGEDGNVRVDLPTAAQYNFNLHREDGHANVPAEAVFTKQGKHRWLGQVGAAPEFTVKGSVEDGSISIR